MRHCPECGQELINTPGRRPKTFCNNTCRSKYWYGLNRKIKSNNKPENKERILKERNTPVNRKAFKEPLTTSEVFERAVPEIDNSSILEQIKAIKNEKIPKERDTVFGRKSWAIDQNNRIEELKKQLK